MPEASFAFTGLDRIFHERGRLAICSALVANSDGLSFTQLQEACELTDGNLNRHLHALAELGIVDMVRIKGKGRPQTIVRITSDGRSRFLDYIDELESVVREVQRSRKRKASPTRTVPATSTSQ
ncbi:MAG TPA: transcriptional regulator [Candidatus Baltobacteraceae bacterium]|nr:transcriptional regulator [Candidatus Baltobacteraceae bacterium]